ncbi:hypothetical protein [Actinomadura sp. HBU206391]|uniref:hypothetical protein n=1 Tax=Actinomadura sp. HBU206391 TaxID=2731692 RepID=UPI0016501422|nr:hypothetical protein [Actinomadura sp. HBU206391]MBC6457290.1 hypothetical protein [Actinomadura sp. HBU206391]
MIPTMILFGLVFGRWWRASLLAAAVIWPVVLLAGDVTTSLSTLAGGAGLAVLNTLVGVAIHQGVLSVVRSLNAVRTRANGS